MIYLLWNRGRYPRGTGSNPPGPIDLGDITDRLALDLNAADTTAMHWWTKQELFDYANSALDYLSKQAAIWTSRQTLSTTPGEGSYNCPDTHVGTYSVTAGIRQLEPATAREMMALDPLWQDEEDDEPTHFVPDYLGLHKIRLYPKPEETMALTYVEQDRLAEVTIASDSFSAPPFVRDYLEFAILTAARAKESKAQMLDVADFASEMMQMIVRIAKAYWGRG